MAASGQSRARAGLQRHRQRRRCYSGEVLHQFDLFIGERTDLLAEDGDSTDQFTLLEHRYKEVGSRASGFHEGDEAGVALDIALLRHQVDNVDNAPGCRAAGEWVTRIVIDDKDRVPTPSLGVGARRVLLGNDTKRFFLIEKQIGELRLAQPRRVREYGLEHMLQLAGRTADDTQHLGGRRLLLQRLGQIAVRWRSSFSRRVFSMAITA